MSENDRNGSAPRLARIVPQDGRPAAILVGRDAARWTDLYHVLLTIRWSSFLGAMALVYVAANAVFALLYLLDPGGVANARPGSFWDAFFFSVQTIGTLGYGVMAPQSFYAHVVVTIETFFGLVNLAIGTGLIFARFSRPTARILFSRVAVIAPFEGVPTLMFRAANRRRNQILEAEVMVNFVRHTVTREGMDMRRFDDLTVMRSRSPLFALSWTVMHPIDDASPLYGATPESLAEAQAEIVVVISGTDETYSQRIHARYSYLAEDILWDRRFVDILTITPDGRRIVDYGLFHDVEPAEPGNAPAWTAS